MIVRKSNIIKGKDMYALLHVQIETTVKNGNVRGITADRLTIDKIIAPLQKYFLNFCKDVLTYFVTIFIT